jgi:hypothetical protein
LRGWRSHVIASEAKQSRPYMIKKMEIASVVFDSLAMTIMGLTQSSPLQTLVANFSIEIMNIDVYNAARISQFWLNIMLFSET